MRWWIGLGFVTETALWDWPVGVSVTVALRVPPAGF